MKCNIVLSGGGMRGSAHIGVLKALFEKGVQPAGISGSSAGAFIGAFICDGYQPEEIAEIIIRHEPGLKLGFSHLKKGLMDFKPVRDILRKNLRHNKIEELIIPLFIAVTNLENGTQSFLTKGDIIQAVSASSAIPIILPPVEINNSLYGDGGISNNLPVEPFVSSSYPTIGVHVNPISAFNKEGDWLENMERTLHLLMRRTVMQSKEQCVLFIEPQGLSEFKMFEHGKSEEMIKIAYDYTLNNENLNALIRG